MELAIGIMLACCALGAGICMGIGAIGPAIGEGNAVAKSCEAIGRQPEAKGAVTSTMVMVVRSQRPRVFTRWLSLSF